MLDFPSFFFFFLPSINIVSSLPILCLSTKRFMFCWHLFYDSKYGHVQCFYHLKCLFCFSLLSLSYLVLLSFNLTWTNLFSLLLLITKIWSKKSLTHHRMPSTLWSTGGRVSAWESWQVLRVQYCKQLGKQLNLCTESSIYLSTHRTGVYSYLTLGEKNINPSAKDKKATW